MRVNVYKFRLNTFHSERIDSFTQKEKPAHFGARAAGELSVLGNIDPAEKLGTK